MQPPSLRIELAAFLVRGPGCDRDHIRGPCRDVGLLTRRLSPVPGFATLAPLTAESGAFSFARSYAPVQAFGGTRHLTFAASSARTPDLCRRRRRHVDGTTLI